MYVFEKEEQHKVRAALSQKAGSSTQGSGYHMSTVGSLIYPAVTNIPDLRCLQSHQVSSYTVLPG